MASPADRQAEANADLDRITEEIRGGLDDLDNYQEVRALVANLLQRDVIRVGQRPQVQTPMDGQRTIEDELGET